jgi:caffeoyl-CoA O-methyltransferase
MGRSFFATAELQNYLIASASPADSVLTDLQVETAALGGISQMQIAPEQGAFLTILAGAIGAREIVEVGTFTGYSSISLARGLTPGGRVQCFDVSEEWTAIARRYWERAGVADRISLTIGPAAESLAKLPQTPTLDLAFIDADKTGYPQYVELLLPRLRQGGLLLLDNTLRGGGVLPSQRDMDDEGTRTIVGLNETLAADPRVETVLLPLADGLTICRKL